MIEEGRAPHMIQWEGAATYDQKWSNKSLAKVQAVINNIMSIELLLLSQINWKQPALTLHNFIRGNDKVIIHHINHSYRHIKGTARYVIRHNTLRAQNGALSLARRRFAG